jgi:hypothetical protein
MPNPNTDPEGALRKLGQRLRQGWAKQHPTSEKTIETVKETVREEWERQRNATRSQPNKPSPAKERSPQPDEPDQEH